MTDLCRRHGLSSAASLAWKANFGRPEVSNAKRLRRLKNENFRLKLLLADVVLDNAGMIDRADILAGWVESRRLYA